MIVNQKSSINLYLHFPLHFFFIKASLDCIVEQSTYQTMLFITYEDKDELKQYMVY